MRTDQVGGCHQSATGRIPTGNYRKQSQGSKAFTGFPVIL